MSLGDWLRCPECGETNIDGELRVDGEATLCCEWCGTIETERVQPTIP